MRSEGVVICFQKYTLGTVLDSNINNISDGPVCFGYFGRVDVQEVFDFKDYIQVASRHGVEQACSRKQLLLYRISEEYDSDIAIVHGSTGQLPFRCASGKLMGLCCCTALNVSPVTINACGGLRQIAFQLKQSLEVLQKKHTDNFHFAIMGLLGAEDLCVISLSNRYDIISEATSAIQMLRISSDDVNKHYAVDNSHSILMMDTSEDSVIEIDGWKDVHAEIHFSLKSAEGAAYLDYVKQQLVKESGEGLADSISIESRTGEYDTVIRCPASSLGRNLYGKKGLISYSNKEYQKIAYQSETIFYPFGSTDSSPYQVPQEDNASTIEYYDDGLVSIVADTVESIKTWLIGNDKKNNDLAYIEFALYRLLKDYRRIAAFPYSDDLRRDFAVQFMAAVNAIKDAAERCKGTGLSKKIHLFNNDFDNIVNALSDSMQAASQFDRLSFDEQPSYLQNIGSYHKILRSYYGIIKDILKLLYSIERNSDSCQPIIIPLLSFGLTPIITSKGYDSKYTVVTKNGTEEYKAMLVCITLPYQALANPPKYLGILIHELFHYAAPTNRKERNLLICRCLTKAAASEFIGLLAVTFCPGIAQNFGHIFQEKYSNLFSHATDSWANNLLKSNPLMSTARLKVLHPWILKFLQFSRDPQNYSYQNYFLFWKNLRKQLFAQTEISDVVVRKIFALDLGATCTNDVLAKAFDDRIKTVLSFSPLCKLLKKCIEALEELTPDLFDLGLVICNKNRRKWAEQYFWQIHSTRCDILSGSTKLTQTVDEQIQAAEIDTNVLRIGFFMDFCLANNENSVENRLAEFSTCLDEWCKCADKTSQEKLSLAKIQFRHDFKIYTQHVAPYAEPAMQLCQMVVDSILPLYNNKECSTIIARLTDFYERYYSVLENRQRGKLTSMQVSELQFKICVDLIESYQKQDDISNICKINYNCYHNDAGKLSTPHATSEVRECEEEHDLSKLNFTVAEYSGDLSRAIRTAYNAMSPSSIMPQLWYRGQRLKHRKSLPNVMRGESTKHNPLDPYENQFFFAMREEIRLARAQILPVGNDFSQADWLAFLQHNGFKTSVLDFSEEFYPALFFAIERWVENPNKAPEEDARITMFNPVLFNLAMDALDNSTPQLTEPLKYYLENGKQKPAAELELPLFARDEKTDSYKRLYDWDMITPEFDAGNPRAALIPKNCERMKKQSGQFVFYDLHCQMKENAGKTFSYAYWSLEELHKRYVQLFQGEDRKLYIPFMYDIYINHVFYKDFVEYIQAIGLRKYRVYPELDKLAEDITRQLGLR